MLQFSGDDFYQAAHEKFGICIWKQLFGIFSLLRIVNLWKVPFFSVSEIRFSHLHISPKNIHKNYPELEIWNSRPYQSTTYSNFKFRIVFWNNFFGGLKKHIALSEKKPPLPITNFNYIGRNSFVKKVKFLWKYFLLLLLFSKDVLTLRSPSLN